MMLLLLTIEMWELRSSHDLYSEVRGKMVLDGRQAIMEGVPL